MALHPLVEKFVAGQLPEPMANALVGGSLPVPPQELLAALAFAYFQETPQAEKAVETLLAMPGTVLESAIVGPVEPSSLGLLLVHRKEPALLETALLHESLTAAWMERAVPHLPGSVLEIPLNNQVMWIERPAILDLLEAHPEAEYVIKRRIEEFRRDVLRQLSAEQVQERLEIIDEVEAGNLDRAWSELPPPQDDTEEERAAEAESPAEAPNPDAPVLDLDGHEIRRTVTQRIMKLRTNQKILLATKGGKEERTVLIRESNRLIQVAVIRNGRITEAEVQYIAQMRTVHDEVLRIISMTKDWMKKYQIVKNLVQNPRTPLPIALNQLKRINEFDMKLMAKDRNVAEVLRREAKRIVEAKQSGKG